MTSCLSCGMCAACKPKYRRHVDSIYPSDVTQGVVKANLQKLTFYAISHPEKLDKIGAYLSSKIDRDVYRQRRSQVLVGCEAMDQLLTACHGTPSLNLFVESFLKIVQKLLETADPGLEIRATQSFESFSTKQEDTPGYHRRYDFFICKFSAMCHNNNINLAVQDRVRNAGLKGLRGVVRKTVGDDLAANIWERQHMEKIVPSILYNLHDKSSDERQGDDEEMIDGEDDLGASNASITPNESPRQLADVCLRELVGKASFGNMKSVLTPLLRHCDNHNLWTPTPPAHAIAFFKAVMYSIQNQYLYVVVRMLIDHIDAHSTSTSGRVDTRIGIACVLSQIIGIAAHSIGPALLDIFNSLLRHLRASVEADKIKRDLPDTTAIINLMVPRSLTSTSHPSDEQRLQDTLITTMGDFAQALPNYQKFEVMMFVLGKVPHGGERLAVDRYLQHVLVKTLLQVATKYQTKLLGQTFTPTFMDSLVKLALVEDNRVRLSVQMIFHTLLDRHENTSAVAHVRMQDSLGALDITVEKCERADLVFWRANGSTLMSMMFETVVGDWGRNSRYTYDATLATMLLIFVELGACDEALIDLTRLALAMQSAANDPSDKSLSIVHRARLHFVCIRFMHCVRQLCDNEALEAHVNAVCAARATSDVPLIDPESAWHVGKDTMDENSDEVLSDEDEIRANRTISRSRDGSFPTGRMAAVSVTAELSFHDGEPDICDSQMLAQLAAGQLPDDVMILPRAMLFDVQTISNALQHSNVDVTRLHTTFVPRSTTKDTTSLPHTQSGLAGKSDLRSISFSMVSNDSDHARQTRRNTLLPAFLDGADAGADEADAVVLDMPSSNMKDMIVMPPKVIANGRAKAVNINAMREALAGITPESMAAKEKANTQAIHDLFTNSTYEQLVQMQRAQYSDTAGNVARVLRRASARRKQWEGQPSAADMPTDPTVPTTAAMMAEIRQKYTARQAEKSDERGGIFVDLPSMFVY